MTRYAAVAVAAAFVLAACGPTVTPSPAPMRSAAPAPSAAAGSARPSAPPPATVATPPPSLSPLALPAGVAAAPLGRLSGDMLFTLRKAAPPRADSGAVLGELWAIPLDGRPPMLAARYVSLFGTNRPDLNDVKKQLSPDGKRFVLQVARPRGSGYRWGLAVVDLESGAITALGRDDDDQDTDPAWSPDGARIAYVRTPNAPARGTFDDGIWSMGAAGDAPRREIATFNGAFSQVFDWVVPGIEFGNAWESLSHAIYDPRSGRTTLFGQTNAGTEHDWRAETFELVGAFNGGGLPPSDCRLAIADGVGQPLRTLISSRDCSAPPGRPRWRPGADEVLYRQGGHLRIVGSRDAGRIVDLPTADAPGAAEWAPDGAAVIYLTTDAQRIRRIARDGSTDSLVATLPASELRAFDLVVRRY